MYTQGVENMLVLLTPDEKKLFDVLTEQFGISENVAMLHIMESTEYEVIEDESVDSDEELEYEDGNSEEEAPVSGEEH